MLEPFRSDFNARFTGAKYAELKRRLDERTRTHIAFRIAETPCFFPRELMDRMIQAGVELTSQLLGNVRYLQESQAAIPAEFCVPNQDAHPNFMTVDFGLVRDAAEAGGDAGVSFHFRVPAGAFEGVHRRVWARSFAGVHVRRSG